MSLPTTSESPLSLRGFPGAGPLSAPVLERAERTSEMPLSFGQQRLWFLDQFEPGSGAYNIPFGLRVRGNLDFSALRQALNEIVRRHEVLRTTFPPAEGHPVPVQKINAVMELVPEEVDLRAVGAEEREAEAFRMLRDEAGKPFDLARGPLMRVKLFRLDEDELLLTVTMHHIVSDGWSGGLMVREFAQLYSAYAKGGKSPLPELKIQYADFAVWQRRWMQGEVLETQREYWRQQLAQVRALELPADFPRPAATSSRAASLTRQLPADLVRRVKKFALQESATPFMVLLACWQWLLGRYSGQGDVTCGTVIAGRNRVETEKLIGFFVNTLVLRTRVRSEQTFRELLKSVRQTTLDAWRHQDLPFEALVEDLDVQGNLSRHPLFDVMFVMQNTPPRTLTLQGLILEEVRIETPSVKVDLTLFAEERGEELDCRLKYNAGHFEGPTIERMLGHWQVALENVALENMVGSPERRIGEVSLLSAEEREQMLVEWNRTAWEYEKSLVHELFERQVRRSPQAIAVEFEGQRLTYEQLNRRANQLAHYLRKLGVRPEARVGICMERGLEMVTGLLAVLKAGGAYVPLDPGYPSEWLNHMLEDAQVSVLVTQSQFTPFLPANGFPVVLLKDILMRLREENGENLSGMSVADNLAYVIYTSGSTGRPKGVMVSQRSFANHLQWRQRVYPLAATDRFLHKASLSFDIAGWEIFAPLTAGAQLVVCIPEGQRDSVYLAELIAQARITVAHFSPPMLRAFLDEPSVKNCRDLKRIFCGGEVMSADLQDRFMACLPAALHNQYGPTETSIDVLVWDCADGRGRRAVPIGRPIDNTFAYVLDSGLQPLPAGVPGELHIAGLPLARGYLNRADSTAERYIPNPFSATPGERLFKTGDLVRYCRDGSIEFIGRTDRQVKVRGYRVELEAIEAVLNSHEGVRAVAVVAAQGVDGDQRLAAYVAGDATDEDLRAHVKSRMPEYMTPSVFVRMASLPLTVTGKIDRKALPAPEAGGGERNSDERNIYVGPRNGEEEVLCGIFSEVLKLGQPGIHSNFFELGGHSLMATQIISRVRHIFGVEVPLRALFEAPTVAGLAERIRETLGRRSPEGPEIKRVAREGGVPLSWAQQRLWFLNQMDPESAAYNVPVGLRLRGTPDRKAIENSLNEIVRRHEVLRTSFGLREGGPVQEIAAELRVPLEETDLRNVPQAAREKEARRLAREEAEAPFDLVRGPLLRIRLLQLEEQDYVLMLTMHHIVSDGWSMGILVREFCRLYEAEVKGEPVAAEELKIQYADFAVWQREWLRGEILEEQSGYWKKQLAGVPGLGLPTDYPRPAVLSHRGGSVELRLGTELTARLKELGRREGVTLFMGLLAAFQIMLSRYAGEPDVAVGTAIANRNRVETEALIGFFVNTLVLRTDLSGNPDFREVLKRVRQVALDAYQRQDVPFEKLVEELAPHRDLSRSPLFQVMLVVQNAGQQELQLPGLKVSGLETGSETAKFDLLLTLSERACGIEGKLTYARDLYEAPTMERMVGHLRLLLEKLTTHPDLRIADVSLLSGEERHQLLTEWNRTEAEYCRQPVHELFEEQAANTPNAVAVEFEGQEWTYQELNRRANRLGHYLRKLGVGPEIRVGICMERSLEMVTGLLGIMKAGGAYVPLDPGYPVERLAYMLQDACAAVIVVQEKLVPLLSGYSGVVVTLDSEDSVALESDENPGVHVDPLNLAYVIYTSGSTGQPRGAMNTHRGLSNRLQWMQQAYQLRADDRVLQKTPFSFDVSVWEFFWPLMTGARLVVAQPGGHQDAEYLRELIQRREITTLHFVPSMLGAFLESGGPQTPGSVRRVICSGEALGKELAQRYLDRMGADLHNLYGPTEAAIDVTFWKCERAALEKGVAIGKPIGNMQVYVLDEQMEPQPVGLPGELYLAGAGLGRGYLARPELTAARWVPDPFSATGGDRLYGTGDLVRYRADGNLEFMGRNDHQVKLRGHRIELGEIESALMGHPDVRQAAVLIRDESLVAYVSGGSGGSKDKDKDEDEIDGSNLNADDLRRSLREKLPEYMVPSAFVMLNELPLTPSGKTDRRALPAIPVVRDAAQYVAPAGDVEERLCEVWADVLKLKQVGVEDNFFDLGGHSLLATQVMSRVQQIFPVKLRLRVIFRTPTVRGLAQEIESAMRSDAANPHETKPRSPSAPPILTRKTSQMKHSLDELESMSEEEVQALLDAQSS